MQQVRDDDESVRDFASYVPIGDAPRKIGSWNHFGAQVCYLSSHTDAADVEKDRFVLERFGFPTAPILFRQGGATYETIVAGLDSEVLVEDDCESIGGEKHMVYPNLSQDRKRRIVSIVVKEFAGIDHLPDDPSQLLTVSPPPVRTGRAADGPR